MYKPGEDAPTAKLTNEQAFEVRIAYHSGKISVNQIVKKYGIQRWAVSNLIHGHTWKNVTMPEVSVGRERRGEYHPRTKLIADQVREIKKLLCDGVPNVEIAIQYNVSSANICDIRKGRQWKHVTIDEDV